MTFDPDPLTDRPRSQLTHTGRRPPPRPEFRKLRVFAVDPGLTARFETAVVNEMTLYVPWEHLDPGPRGEYVEVIDEDQGGDIYAAPVDLNWPEILASDGLTPCDGDPHFHQQMVYAVAMRTIRTFERALGRRIHWRQPPSGGKPHAPYEPHLKLFPHFMRDANAYFDPGQGAVRFGHLLTTTQSSHVFTCLSQDIIAHTVTRGVLLGMGMEFEGNEENPDCLALFEGFADLVTVLQHFWKSEFLRTQIAAIQGDLTRPSPLGAIALQLSEELGSSPYGLRNAFGMVVDGKWAPRRPDPEKIRTAVEPHDRGDILVGAVGEAFRRIYESRTVDLRRIASRGTGRLPEGSLHPDLVDRLTREAAWTADMVLDMCIRALDYLPPVGVTFGDLLRAGLTSDFEINPADVRHYRVAFLESFKAYGILPREVRMLSVQTLLWPGPKHEAQAEALKGFVKRHDGQHDYRNPLHKRAALWRSEEQRKRRLVEYLTSEPGLSDRLGEIDLKKPFEVRAFHPHRQAPVWGSFSYQWIIKLVQPPADPKKPGSLRQGGTTFVVDADTGDVKYQIDKPPPSRSPSKKARQAVAEEPLRLSPLMPPRTTERRLRVFAFDPAMGVALETAGINEVTLCVPWERDIDGNDVLRPGPVGEYLEVVDRDPASRAFYAPVDLNDPHLVAECGLLPSESNPQFHQQMVYAVAMRTIRTFEQALGRLALWSPRRAVPPSKNGGKWQEERYVQRLRVYPHALREPNAYYSPDKKALLFGYFPDSGDEDRRDVAPLTVFTCVSHDIIAHETTHALLDGMHRRFNEPSNPDVLAFHEAFADIVALFQHFSLPEVLRHQIAATRGDLESQNLLGELAQQFGKAIGNRGALRSALGSTDPVTKQWKRSDPDPDAYQKLKEPHDRGALLVTAVFDAFLTVYKAAVADLLRIATDGTGVLPAGHLHPDLVNRLADEAAKSAGVILNMCIRALDYCPPVDLTLGDYLRAVVTADFEFDPVDETHRRVAFIEAFRRHGIVPQDVRALSVDGLRWRPSEEIPDEDEKFIEIVKGWTHDIDDWNLTKSRETLFELMKDKQKELHKHLAKEIKSREAVTGGIFSVTEFQVHSIRPSFRTDWKGCPRFQWVIELIQSLPVYADPAELLAEPVDPSDEGQDPKPDYYFRGGTTLVVNAETGEVRYSIKKRMDDPDRQKRQRRFMLEEGNESLAATYFGKVGLEKGEPFAMLHRL